MTKIIPDKSRWCRSVGPSLYIVRRWWCLKEEEKKSKVKKKKKEEKKKSMPTQHSRRYRCWTTVKGGDLVFFPFLLSPGDGALVGRKLMTGRRSKTVRSRARASQRTRCWTPRYIIPMTRERAVRPKEHFPVPDSPWPFLFFSQLRVLGRRH